MEVYHFNKLHGRISDLWNYLMDQEINKAKLPLSRVSAMGIDQTMSRVSSVEIQFTGLIGMDIDELKDRTDEEIVGMLRDRLTSTLTDLRDQCDLCIGDLQTRARESNNGVNNSC